MNEEIRQPNELFESMEPARAISRKAYQQLLTDLRADLLQAQIELADTRQSVIITIAGVDGAGKGEVIQLLNEWLDPRGLETHSFWNQESEVAHRPYQWRFWQAIPRRGRMHIWFGGMYADVIAEGVEHRHAQAWIADKSQEILAFEDMLQADGTSHLKLWLHLNKGTQRRRLKDLYENPKEHWRAMRDDWKHHNLYEAFSETAAEVISLTHVQKSPWRVVDASDKSWRNIEVGRFLHEHMLQAIRAHKAKEKKPKQKPWSKQCQKNWLDEVDLRQRLTNQVYQDELIQHQARCHRLFWEAYERKIPTVLVFEGWDAAGKGSAIKRVTAAIDARLYRIVSVAAPTEEEHQFHYLWRFWKPLPPSGQITIFDRSWYGRVLVERIEGFAQSNEWQRAYQEINTFEDQLVQHGCVVCKFWIHISKEKQLERFQKRLEIPYKRHKITEEDWRNRKQWPAYQEAINDMIDLTHTDQAPWTLIAGNNKKFARIQILKTVCASLEKALSGGNNHG